MRLLRSLVVLLGVCSSAYSQTLLSEYPSTGHAVDPKPDLALRSSVYVKVRLEKTVKVSALRPGDVIEGKLAQDVYSGDRKLFAAGSRVRLTVDKLGRRPRVPNDHWPWVVKAFTPRHENYPTFQSAIVSLPSGKEVTLRVSLSSINRKTEVQAQARTKRVADAAASSVTNTGDATTKQASLSDQTGSKDTGLGNAGSRDNRPFVILEAANSTEVVTFGEDSSGLAIPGPVTLATGTRAKIILLSGVSASESRPGDSFQARLVEPVWSDSKVVLPEGTLLRGRVAASTAPRMLSRAGSLLLTFTDLTLPGGTDVPAVASVTATELDQRSHTKIDAEGRLHGDRPGKVWMAINLAATGGIAKAADDVTQLLVEALISSATDASTAGTARIVGVCASGLFLLTRHGRDVVLPRFTEMNIVFDRPVSLVGFQPAWPTGRPPFR